jgi:hypothetical protein
VPEVISCGVVNARGVPRRAKVKGMSWIAVTTINDPGETAERREQAAAT